jgi:hypothetical protein
VTQRDLTAAAIGALVGALVALVAASLVWPRGSEGAAAAGDAVATVTASPLPTALPGEEPTSEADEGDDSSSSSKEQDDGDQNRDGKPSAAPPLADAPPAGEGPLPDASQVTCPDATVTVSNADELQKALDDARPGDTVALAAGTYTGEFHTTASGSPDQPIFLCGPADAVLDGGDIKGGYVLHLDGAKYWRLVGFSVTGGQKGVMADTTVGSVIQGLTVSHIGDEAIHLRDNSTDNVVLDNTISDTGLRRDKFGEGVYVGTAVSNWCSYTACQPDRSDRNVVKGNTITDVTSEAVDAKEGTTGGVIVGNTFGGARMSGADSWVDMKGNNWLVKDNTGTDSTEDGFQTHQILDGWGDHNVFTGNHAEVHGPGLGIALRPEESNVVTCSNTVVGAGEGLSNIACS